MIANLLNFLIGLWVVYVAIFGMPAGTPSWILAPLGIIIVVLALIARRRDFSGWQSATNSVLGIALVIEGVRRNCAIAYWNSMSVSGPLADMPIRRANAWSED
jgi:hypothetical protein